MRLDRALVARGLARSRTHAQTLIGAGAVTVNGAVLTRAAADTADADAIVVDDDGYVSRAAHKLIGALDACQPLGLHVEGRNALDAGAMQVNVRLAGGGLSGLRGSARASPEALRGIRSAGARPHPARTRPHAATR